MSNMSTPYDIETYIKQRIEELRRYYVKYAQSGSDTGMTITVSRFNELCLLANSIGIKTESIADFMSSR